MEKDGFDQVMEMLRMADKDFVASLLSRLEVRDPALAAEIRRDLEAGKGVGA